MSYTEKPNSVIRGEEERRHLVSEYEASSMTMGIQRTGADCQQRTVGQFRT